MTAIVFVDLETTGLDAQRHEIWEAAAVKMEYLHDSIIVKEAHWFVSVALVQADDEALAIGGFRERWDPNNVTSAWDFIGEFGEFTTGLTIAANNVAFDMSFLKRYWSGIRPDSPYEPWHYSPLDVKSYAAGSLGLAWPLPKSSVIGDLLGVTKNNRPHHAMADAHYAAELYEAARLHHATWNP